MTPVLYVRSRFVLWSYPAVSTTCLTRRASSVSSVPPRSWGCVNLDDTTTLSAIPLQSLLSYYSCGISINLIFVNQDGVYLDVCVWKSFENSVQNMYLL